MSKNALASHLVLRQTPSTRSTSAAVGERDQVYGDLVTNMIYDTCVLDANVSVHVTLNFSRARGVAAVGRNVLEPIAEA